MMKKMSTILATGTLFIGLTTTAQAAITGVYANIDDFSNAVSNILTENFEDNTYISGFSITENNGAGQIKYNNMYSNTVSSVDNRYQVFNYAPGMYGFGVWIDTQTGSKTDTKAGINVYINNGSVLAMQIPTGTQGQFYGFVSDTAFTDVKFQAQNEGSEAYYNIDCAVAPTPIPAAAWLMASGLLGLVGLKRKKNSEA